MSEDNNKPVADVSGTSLKSQMAAIILSRIQTQYILTCGSPAPTANIVVKEKNKPVPDWNDRREQSALAKQKLVDRLRKRR